MVCRAYRASTHSVGYYMTIQPQPPEGCGAPKGSSALLTVPQTDGTYKIEDDQRYIIDEE